MKQQVAQESEKANTRDVQHPYQYEILPEMSILFPFGLIFAHASHDRRALSATARDSGVTLDRVQPTGRLA